MTIRQAELAAAGILMLTGVMFVVFSIPLLDVRMSGGPGAGVYPLWVGVLQTICGLAYLRNLLRLQGFAPGEKFIEAVGRQRWLLLQSAVSLVVYIATMPYLGFVPGTFLLVVFHLRVIGGHSWLFSVLFSVAAAAVCDYFFRVLMYTPLPSGLLGWF